MNWKDRLVMKNRGWLFSLLLDWVWQVGGSVEHSEGKCGESIVAILGVPMW
jgi:hypothetical protein